MNMMRPSATGNVAMFVEPAALPTELPTEMPTELPTDAWRFKLGQCISHKDQPMPSLVLSRHRGGKHEIYGVRSFATVDPNRDRMIMGSVLVDVVPGTEPCLECLLHLTGMCPGER